MTDRILQRRKYDAKRRGEKESRRWYKSPAWAIRRKHQLAEHPTCALCDQEGVMRIRQRMIVDHHPAHNEDYQAFFFGPLRTLCKHHHDTIAQADEARGFSLEVGEDGWPTDPQNPFVSGGAVPQNRNKR